MLIQSELSPASDHLTILIAPNVSEQMGGEALKALNIYTELKKVRPQTIQITHARNQAEIQRLVLEDVYFVQDDWLMIWLWKTRVLRWLIDLRFQQKALALAQQIITMNDWINPQTVIIHQTEPNSPVLPRLRLQGYAHVFGPINGNIYWPKPFRRTESLKAKLRRWLHLPLQSLRQHFADGLQQANLILVAGGERTRQSLQAAGCPTEVMADTLDCGVANTLAKKVTIHHSGQNFRFVHYGRLVAHKGTSLIIRSLVLTQNPVCLDIIGQGPELQNCQDWVFALGLSDRVRFLDWFEDRDDLFRSFSQYRGMVLPSLEDANGIVVQEAMALGLPPICLNWGGPQLLIEHGRSGYLVEPTSEDKILQGLAWYMDRLGEDGNLAQTVAQAAQAASVAWQWSQVMPTWDALYLNALQHHQSQQQNQTPSPSYQAPEPQTPEPQTHGHLGVRHLENSAIALLP